MWTYCPDTTSENTGGSPSLPPGSMSTSCTQVGRMSTSMPSGRSNGAVHGPVASTTALAPITVPSTSRTPRTAPLLTSTAATGQLWRVDAPCRRAAAAKACAVACPSAYPPPGSRQNAATSSSRAVGHSRATVATSTISVSIPSACCAATEAVNGSTLSAPTATR